MIVHIGYIKLVRYLGNYVNIFFKENLNLNVQTAVYVRTPTCVQGEFRYLLLVSSIIN